MTTSDARLSASLPQRIRYRIHDLLSHRGERRRGKGGESGEGGEDTTPKE